MKKILKRGLLLFGVYMIFTAYLFFASDRIEKLENTEDVEYVNVTINYHE